MNTHYFFDKNTKMLAQIGDILTSIVLAQRPPQKWVSRYFFGFLHTWEDICLLIFRSTSYEKRIYQLPLNGLFA